MRGGITVMGISTDDHLVTVISARNIAPDDQKRCLVLLIGATATSMHRRAGPVSANLGVGLDDTRVDNGAQRRSRDDVEPMHADPEAAGHVREACGIAAAIEPHFLRVDHGAVTGEAGRR